jgi:hypothetical protein
MDFPAASCLRCRGRVSYRCLCQSWRSPIALNRKLSPDTVVIVDTGNYYPQERDGRIEAIEAGTTESRWVAQQLNRPAEGVRRGLSEASRERKPEWRAA